MADTDVIVKFGAQLDQLITAVGQVNSTLGSGFNQIEASGKQSAKNIDNAFANAAKSMADSANHIHEGFTGAFEKINSAMSKLKGVFVGLTALLAGGEMFKDMIADSVKWTTSTVALSKMLGITTEDASVLGVALKISGISNDTYTDSLMKLLRQFKTNAPEMAKLGLSLTDVNGKTKDGSQVLTDAVAVMMSYAAGTDRDNAAIFLFGKSAAEAMSLQKLNNDVMTRATALTAEYGLDVTPKSAAEVKKFQTEQRVLGLVWDSMSDKVAHAMIPVLTDLAVWFNSVGPAAVDVFSWVVKQLIQFFEETIVVGVELYQTTKATWDSIVVVTSAAWEKLKALATGNWTEYKQINTQSAAELVQIWQKANDAMVTAFQAGDARVNKMWNPPKADAKDDTPQPNAAGGNKTWQTPTKDGEQVAQWKAQLQEQLMDSKNYFADSQAIEIQFWTAKLALTQSGTKAYAAVIAELYPLQKQLANQWLSDYSAGLKIQETTTAKSEQAKLVIVQNGMSDLQRANATSTAVYKSLQQEEVDIKRKIEAEKVAITKGNADTAISMSKLDLADKKADLDEEVKSQTITEGQKYELLKDFAQQEHDLDLKQLDDYIATLDKQNVEYAAALNKRSILNKTYENQMQANNRASLDVQRNEYLDYTKTLTTSFTSAANSIISGQMTMKQGVIKVAGDMIDMMVSKLANYVATYIANQLLELTTHTATETAKTGATVAGTVARGAAEETASAEGLVMKVATGIEEITIDAYKAAAGAYAALASIPYVGPVVAPVAAAAALAAVIGFASSFDKGTMNVPSDQMAQIHAGEIIVPAAQSAKIRAGLKQGGVGAQSFSQAISAGGGGGVGGDMHLHIHAIDTQSGAQFVQKNGHHIVKEINARIRNGAKMAPTGV